MMSEDWDAILSFFPMLTPQAAMHSLQVAELALSVITRADTRPVS